MPGLWCRGRVRGEVWGRDAVCFSGDGFLWRRMGELLDSGDNIISPEAETPACIYTSAVAAPAPHTDLSAGTRTAVTVGHRHAALCPPGHCWQPLITGVMWACQPDHTERCVSHSAGKVSRTLASALNVCIFHPETYLKIMCGSYQIHILVNDMVLIFFVCLIY